MFKYLISTVFFTLVSARPDVSHLVAGSDYYLPQPDPQFGSAVYRPSGYLDFRTNVGPDGKIVIKRPVIKTGKPLVTKDFFVHTAPNDGGPLVQYEDVEYTVNPRIHYNILFAKAPTAEGGKIDLTNVAVAPENKEKTIVYVLAGDNAPFDVTSSGDINLPKPAVPSQPELVFVRYNNEEDIQNVVGQIQSHYNQQHASNNLDFDVIGSEPKLGYNYGQSPPAKRESPEKDEKKE
jgi:hypothetical protein